MLVELQMKIQRVSRDLELIVALERDVISFLKELTKKSRGSTPSGRPHERPYRITTRLTALGHEWADKEPAASVLEETRKSVRSQIALKFLADTGAPNKAEMMAEATDEYASYVKSMIETRRLANIAEVNYNAARVWVDLVRTKEATKRAEMGMR